MALVFLTGCLFCTHLYLWIRTGTKSGIRNKIRYVTVIHYWVEELSKRTGTKWKLRACEIIG